MPISCHSTKKTDYFLWGVLVISSLLLMLALFDLPVDVPYSQYINLMAKEFLLIFKQAWWGGAIGIWAVGVLAVLPDSIISYILGSSKRPMVSITRAVCAGFVLDVCSHGVLMIAAQLYKKGITKSQLVAFLVSTPWNSFGMLLVLGAIQGFFWTFTFLVLSLVLAFTTGWAIFMILERKARATSKHKIAIRSLSDFWHKIRTSLDASYLLFGAWRKGVKEGGVILRWLFLGLLMTASIRSFVPLDLFQTWLAPTFIGMMATLLFATVIEICSEGSAPIAADITVRAHAPGNAFVFLMAGVATDATEAIVLRQITGKWTVSILLPLCVVSQTIPLGIFLNAFAHAG